MYQKKTPKPVKVEYLKRRGKLLLRKTRGVKVTPKFLRKQSK
jgi:hypothetical protein